MNKWVKSLSISTVLTALSFSLPMQTMAQDGSALPTEDEAFAAVFENPADLLLNFRLVGAQFRSGNLKGAVATLERILTLSPDNSEAQALLAGAQFRLGNNSEARRLATILLENPKATPRQKSEINGLIEMIEDAEKQYSINGVVSVGGGVVDNPDGGSIGNQTYSGGVFNKRADAHGFNTVNASVNFTGKFVSQLPERLSVGLAFSRRDTNNYNLGDTRSYSINSRYTRTFDDLQINMGVTTTAMTLDGRQYLDVYNAFASTRYGLPMNISGMFTASATRNVYRNSFDRGVTRKASEKTGTTSMVSAKFTRAFTSFQLGLGVTASDVNARRQYNAREKFDYLADVNFLLFDGIATVGIKHSASSYQKGHPDYGNTVRDDFTNTISASYSIGLGNIVKPLDKEPRLSLSASYGKTKSTIANFSKYSGQGQVLLVQPF